MITNERQYKITKAQAKKFEDALANFENNPLGIEKIDPLIIEAHKTAVLSQLQELRDQLTEYESLQSGEQNVLEVNSFVEFPLALIKARISQGLSQKDLADKLGLKEQQIQRYESTGYTSASLGRIMEVINGLNVRIKEEIILPGAELSLNVIFNKLKAIGVGEEFTKKLLPRSITAKIEDGKGEDESVVYQVASVVRRIFGWSLNELAGPMPLQLATTIGGSARYKVSANATEKNVSVYTLYAHYLALLVLHSTAHLPRKKIPLDPDQIRKEVTAEYGVLTFENMLRYVWDLGVPVLPLQDTGAFHGACWRVDGRNIIVLKQKTNFSSRWLFDLIHELWHSGQEPEKGVLDVIELSETDRERRESQEEKDASKFAGSVVLGGKAEHLVNLCVKEADGRVEYLKAALPKVALREGASKELLANYMAFRLSLQGINWWGTASNLQKVGSPWSVAKDIFFEKCDLSRINNVDRNILLQAFEEE